MTTGSTARYSPELRAADGSAVRRDRGTWQSPLTRRRAFYGYLCLLPWLLGFLGFTLYPVLASAYFSFTDFPILKGPRWVGVENYRTLLFGDDLFWKSL